VSGGARSLRDGLLRRTPAQAVFARRARHRLAVLAYHAVTDRPSFERHVDHVVRTATPITPDQLQAAIQRGERLPDRPVLFTFDDGDPSVVDVAAPVLADRGVTGLAFVVTDHIGTDQPMWWTEVEALVAEGGRAADLPVADGRSAVALLKEVPDGRRRAAIDELRSTAFAPAPRVRQLQVEELRRLEEAGVEVGSHSASHPCLPQATTAEVAAELERSRDALAGWLGHRPRAFAYPNGDRDPRTRGQVADAGYLLAFGFDHRLSTAPPRDGLAISRVRVDAAAPLDRFRLLLSGLHEAVHHRLGRP
jgi:peptidoglycan/xylan/chitin deacetylase (PgdA/CDA1 family)